MKARTGLWQKSRQTKLLLLFNSSYYSIRPIAAGMKNTILQNGNLIDIFVQRNLCREKILIISDMIGLETLLHMLYII